MKAHELNLDSIVFAEMTAKLNEAIQRTVRVMRDKGLTEGTVSAKIKIGVMEYVDQNGEFSTTAIFEPKVTTKVGSSAEEKCGGTGGKITISKDGDVLIGSEQVTMDEVIGKQKGA